MFEEADSLGVSQGQGRGFAQVFDSTYNPVFKEETARLIEKDKAGKKEIDRQLESIDGGVWFRDQPLVQEKIFDLQKYAQDNYRSIGRGNTNEALEYKKKITDIKAVVTQSKLAEEQVAKYLFALQDGGKKFDEDKSKKSIQAFIDAPGNFDISQLQLFANFDAMKHQKDLAGLVGKITQDTQLLPGFKDLNDNTIYKKFVNTIDGEIEKNARSLWLDLPESGREHYNNDFNKYLDIAKSFSKDTASQIVKGKTPDFSLSKKAEQMKYIVKPNENIRISQKVGSEEGDKVGFVDDNTTSLYSVGFNASDEANLDPTQFRDLKGVVVSLGKAYQASGDKTKGYDVSEGLTIEESRDFWKKLSGGASAFKSEQVNVVPVFKVKTIKDEKGRTIDVSNTILSDEHIKSGMFRGNKLTDDMVEFVPYVFGVYNKEVKKGKQENFVAGLPYEKYRDYMQTKPETRKQLLGFEEQMQDDDVLRIKTFTEGREQLGVKPTQPQQTKKAPDNTQKQVKITKDQALKDYNAAVKKAKASGTTDDKIPTFEKYKEVKGYKF
jgi:hypothetical protein